MRNLRFRNSWVNTAPHKDLTTSSYMTGNTTTAQQFSNKVRLKKWKLIKILMVVLSHTNLRLLRKVDLMIETRDIRLQLFPKWTSTYKFGSWKAHSEKKYHPGLCLVLAGTFAIKVLNKCALIQFAAEICLVVLKWLLSL